MASSADPVGQLREVIKGLGAVRNLPEPTLGVYNWPAKTVTLDTGQVIYNPMMLGAGYNVATMNGARVLAIYFQGGHSVACIPLLVTFINS